MTTTLFDGTSVWNHLLKKWVVASNWSRTGWEVRGLKSMIQNPKFACFIGKIILLLKYPSLTQSWPQKITWTFLESTLIQNFNGKTKHKIQSTKVWTLHAISLIRKYFKKTQLCAIITANYYSILYYNAEIWLLPSLKPALRQQLLSASSAPLKLITNNYNYLVSYNTLHYLNQRATPNQITLYKHALLLHKTYNCSSYSNDWTHLHFNQQFNNRNTKVKFTNTAKYKIGNNLLANRFTILNGKIELSWLNDSFESFKIKCKLKFLTLNET